MVSQFLAKLSVPGRQALWLGAVVTLLLSVTVPFSVRQVYWLLEDDRIVEETEDPIVVDYTPGSEVPVVRTSWEAGQTLFVQRTRCIFKVPVGQVHRELIDTVRLPLPSVPISAELALPADAYNKDGSLKPPPWCGRLIVPVTIPSFMTPNPAAYSSTIDAYLNPLKPHVLITLRPARFVITTTPVRTELRENRLLSEAVRREVEAARRETQAKLKQLNADMDLFRERLNGGLTTIAVIEAYRRSLDAYLRSEGILPPPRPPTPPLPHTEPKAR